MSFDRDAMKLLGEIHSDVKHMHECMHRIEGAVKGVDERLKPLEESHKFKQKLKSIVIGPGGLITLILSIMSLAKVLVK